MTDAEDKSRLRKAAKALAAELRRKKVTLDFESSFVNDKSNTGGWSSLIATGPNGVSVSLWLCHFIDRKIRRYWFGFVSERPTDISALIENLPAHLRPNRKIYTSHDLVDISENAYLAHPPTNLSKPIYEVYAREASFYGKYDWGSQSRGGSDFDVSQAAAFLADVIAYYDSNDFHAREGGKRHIKLELRERNSEVARRCKERDDYRCKVCGFHAEERYGAVYAKVADAHHLAPLGRSTSERPVSVRSLITVCPTCHRLLHKMAGNGKEDVKRLKEIVERFKRTESPAVKSPLRRGRG